MEPEVRAYLSDARQELRLAIEGIDRLGDGLEASPWDMHALERCLPLVSEALNQAAKRDPHLGLSITELPRIIALRNLLVHDYRRAIPRMVIALRAKELPLLLAELDSILGNDGESI